MTTPTKPPTSPAGEALVQTLMARFPTGIVWTVDDRGDSRSALLNPHTGEERVFRNEDHVATWPTVPRLAARITVRDRTAAVCVTRTEPLTGAVTQVFYKTIGRPDGQWHQLHTLRGLAEHELLQAYKDLPEMALPGASR